MIITSILATTGLLLAAFIMEYFWWGALIVLGLGALGLFGQKNQKSTWYIELFLVGTVLLVVMGAMIGSNTILLLLSTIAAIAAWDLTRFQRRFAGISTIQPFLDIEKRHLILLGVALGAGVFFAAFVLTTQIPLGFGIALVLAMVLIISVGIIYQILQD